MIGTNVKFADEIFRWVELRYANDQSLWTDSGFHCFRDLPEELRWIPFTEKLECEIENGLLPQLL
jgi:hypothetical protein